MPRKIPALGATCQEASPLSHKSYIPCGRAAVAIVHFPGTGEGHYNMCLMCADHNVRNRRGAYVEEK